MAAADVQETHRSGPLKQKNKPHKHGKHKSKGQLEKQTKGRVNAKILSQKALKTRRRDEKKQQMALKRKQKREEVLSKKRSIGTASSPPHCVAIVKLHSSTSVQTVIDNLKSCDETMTCRTSRNGNIHLSIPRFKQRIELCETEYGHLYETLDAAKVADSVLLLVDVNEGVDGFGEYCLSCLLGQGMPSVTLVTQGLKDIPQKRQKEVKKNLQKLMEKWFPDDKINNLDNSDEGLLVIRQIVSQKLNTVHFREKRPYLLAEHVDFDENLPDGQGTLKLTGYLRSCMLSVNRLVHLPGWGNFQMSQIDVLEDPYPLHLQSNRNRKNEDVEMKSGDGTTESMSVEKPDPTKQESLESEVVPDPMEGEQTWPTEEELNDAMEQRKAGRRVPKGTSEYQASWIIEEEDDDADQEGDENESDDEMEGMEPEDEDMSDEEGGEMQTASDDSDEVEEYETLTSKEDDEDAKYDKTIDMEEEMSIFEKIKEEKKHVMFPDEIDTPVDSNARTRFQKYRGLQSFRTSPWDPKENLPSDYARIFQFDNFRRTEKKLMEQMEDTDGGVMMWSYIRVHITGVPKAFIEKHKIGRPVIAFGLLPHEQKMSVLNVVMRKVPEYTKPVKSKDRLIFHMGFRRFSVCPIFSQHTNGKKHKFERFLKDDTATVATMFAPITFPPAPILVFKEGAFGKLDLVAKGSLLSVDPNRIIAKRAVLSGYPLKINKKSCVVRYMFFNREDINWFKPVELHTKWGRRGHIKDPIGTHGHMKCTFDGHLKSQDTVLMNLYKRVFPKWTFNPQINAPTFGGSLKHVAMETITEDVKEGAAYALFD